MTPAAVAPDSIDTFIARWQAAGGSERANYQLFITELCELLALPKPEPAQAEARDNAYVFERREFASAAEVVRFFTVHGE